MSSKFPDRLRAARQLRDLSQSDLADESGSAAIRRLAF